jgi:hypothetical protein
MIGGSAVLTQTTLSVIPRELAVWLPMIISQPPPRPFGSGCFDLDLISSIFLEPSFEPPNVPAQLEDIGRNPGSHSASKR